MNSIIAHHQVLVLGEVISAASNMVKEIAHYKRAIAELEIQRIQMHEQAKIVHHQIEVQLKTEIHRINKISCAFEQVLQHNYLLIQQHAEREKNIQAQSIMVLQLMAQTTDTDSKQQFIKIWQELNHQMTLNREESARLQAQLMDANQQFGLSISHRDQSFKDIS